MTTEQMKQAELEQEDYELRKAMRHVLIRATESGDTVRLKAAENFLDAMGYTYTMTLHVSKLDKTQRWLICQVEKKWR